MRRPFLFLLMPPSSPPRRRVGVREWWVFSVAYHPETISKGSASIPIQSPILALQLATSDIAAVSNSALRLIALARVLQSTTAIHLEAVDSFITKVGDRESVQGSGSSSPAGGTDDGAYEGNEGDQYE